MMSKHPGLDGDIQIDHHYFVYGSNFVYLCMCTGYSECFRSWNFDFNLNIDGM